MGTDLTFAPAFAHSPTLITLCELIRHVYLWVGIWYVKMQYEVAPVAELYAPLNTGLVRSYRIL